MELKSTHSILQNLLNQPSLLNGPIDFNYNDLLSNISNESKLAIGPHKLPLGYNPKMGSNELYSSVGGGCFKYKKDLDRYMLYKVGGECPVDDVFSQRLMLKGCEPLPRRRCHPKSPANYVDPTPLPIAFLATKPRGTIRIGLDIGGGSGTFAARMKEKNITIVTTSMNFDGPFNSFIASRGLIPMHGVEARRAFLARPFFCLGSELNATYVPMIDRVRFRKMRWNSGMKLDRGVEKNE
ncbi:hypothetical protein BUALT_Bualt15G0100300 [Buddleja alternifolia]|uniref:Methyltransferase n=1 Tax=Buddleja alternifolia TaxID=168488 RepID=A0AAV6WN28_9LAMI|nr:hypothetical protein BUALT_Bualt15G0100300 [Buddleja alternifolia]